MFLQEAAQTKGQVGDIAQAQYSTLVVLFIDEKFKEDVYVMFEMIG